MKDLYTETTKHWWKKFKKTDKCKDIPSSWFRRLNIVKLLMLSKVTILIKISFFFIEIERSILKCVWNLKGPQIAEIILIKNKSGCLTLPAFKTYYKSMVIKVVWYLHKDRLICEWSIFESPERNLAWSNDFP